MYELENYSPQEGREKQICARLQEIQNELNEIETLLRKLRAQLLGQLEMSMVPLQPQGQPARLPFQPARLPFQPARLPFQPAQQPQGQPAPQPHKSQLEVKEFLIGKPLWGDMNGVVTGVNDIEWGDMFSSDDQRALFNGSAIGKFSDEMYGDKAIYLLRTNFDRHAIQIPKRERLMLLMYNTSSQEFNVLRLGADDTFTYFVMTGDKLWVSQEKPTKGIYDEAELYSGVDGFCLVPRCVVRIAGGLGKKLRFMKAGNVKILEQQFKNKFSGLSMRRIWDVVFKDDGAVGVEKSAEYFLLSPLQQPGQPVRPQVRPLQQPGQPMQQQVPQAPQSAQSSWLDDI